MNIRLSFIYAISILLLCIYLPGKTSSSRSKVRQFKQLKLDQRSLRSYQKRYRILLQSFVLGNKNGLKSKDKKAYKTLNLYHLFTPSGLHFGSLLLFFHLLFTPLSKKRKGFKTLLNFSFIFFPFFFEGYWSIKRIALYRAGQLLFSKYFQLPISPYSLFLLIFTMDFLIGTFNASNTSFIFSFTFLGVIFAMLERPKIYWPFAFLGGQIIIAYFMNQPLTSSGFLFGYLLTFIFTLIYPLFLLTAFLPKIFSHLGMIVLQVFHEIVLLLSELANEIGYVWATIPLMLIFILPKKNKIIMPLLLLQSFPAR